MEEIKASFFVECEELLESLFDALQRMADEGASDDIINVAFRAVHSIKGGAGAFSLTDLVAFAHEFETVMDRLRAHQLDFTEELGELFLRSGDVLQDLVRAARDGDTVDPSVTAPLLDELSGFSGAGEPGTPEAEAPIDFAPSTIDLGDLGGGGETELDFDQLPALPPLDDLPPLPDMDAGPDLAAPYEAIDGYVVHFRPTPELYASGNEPLYLLRALHDIGPCRARPISRADDGPRGGRLAWRVEIDSDDAQAIAANFEFVDGLCELRIERRADAATTAPEAEADGEAVEPPAVAAPSSPATAETGDGDDPPTTPPGPVPVVPPTEGSKDEKPAATAVSATVRVDLDRIDRLVNLVGELVINQSMLSQSLSQTEVARNSTVEQGLEELLQLTRDIQESVMMIRAQPVKSLFQRMARIVREASAAVDKKVRLVTEGETTEVDKTVIERLADPLTHMIRNAVDHGLEGAEARAAAGKPPEGIVRLTAAHRSGRVAIEISDDGRGIDRARVFAKAVERGLVEPDANLADAEIDQLLFLPGFSTADRISNLSGRGVGMDVVKNAISALGGHVGITSRPGEGTTFSISLPLTLAVLDGMIVRVEGETLVVPLTAISETLTLSTSDIRPLTPSTSVVKVRDVFVPLLDLGHELGYRAPPDTYDRAVALLIRQEDGRRAALVVDDIEDQRQVVIKGLEDSYGQIPGIAAATILGDGQIALILDPDDIVIHATGQTSPGKLKRAS